ncbi:MAG: hypothetical protein DWQ10_13410 [Calditrichaeota bacterium]|nr:MAG: hypothetical protein DWQ10_13410 [Calditrichota bacterium]
MKMFKRVTELVKANINHLLDQAEDPEVMVKQIIRDMEESIIEMRRETVRAVSRQKQIEKKLATSENLSKDYAAKAGQAVDNGDDALARKILEKKVYTDQQIKLLSSELTDANATSEQLKNDLVQLEDKVQVARRKKEELIRRKRSADAKLRIQESANKARDGIKSAAGKIAGYAEAEASMENYEDSIINLEAEAEAAREIAEIEKENDIDLDKMEKEKAIEDELAKLKKNNNKRV